MRLRNSFVPSISVMYSNPCSISSVASLMSLAVLHVHSSSFIISRIFKRWTYFCVVFQSLCPISIAVSPTSLYFQYRIVANQCLKSYSLMLSSAGSLVLFASFLRIPLKSFPYFLASLLNTLLLGFRLYFMMCACNDLVRFGGIIRVLPHPCFAVVGLTALCSVSMSLTSRACTSVGRIPVSLLNHSLSESIGPAHAISLFSCSSVGSLGILSSGM